MTCNITICLSIGSSKSKILNISSLGSSTSSAGIELPEGVVSKSGSINLIGLPDDINYTKSEDIEIHCQNSIPQYLTFSVVIELNNLDLASCNTFDIITRASDHVGN